MNVQRAELCFKSLCVKRFIILQYSHISHVHVSCYGHVAELQAGLMVMYWTSRGRHNITSLKKESAAGGHLKL